MMKLRRQQRLLSFLKKYHDWLQIAVKPYMARITISNKRFSLMFDKLEILMALSYAYRTEQSGEYYWTPAGSYGYRHDNQEKILKEIAGELSTDGENSIYVTSRLFGDSVKKCTEGLATFQEFVKRLSSRWW
jgi:hypothetical protein